MSRTACRTDQWVANQVARRASVGTRMRSGRYDTRRGPLAVRRKRATGKQASRRLSGVFLLAVCCRGFLGRRLNNERPRHGVKRPCRVLSVCLSRVASCDSVLVALAQFAHQWARGFCICSIARTGDVCPGNCPLRTAENASSGVRKQRNVRVVLFGST